VVITPLAERPGRNPNLNSRRGHEIVHRLQNITAPSVFNTRAFYDGKKNLFSVGPLNMQGDAAEVSARTNSPFGPSPPIWAPAKGLEVVFTRTLACLSCSSWLA
jgi:hypothetical protein